MSDKKSNMQLILETLMEGEGMRSKEISEVVSRNAGKPVKVQDVASMLSRISNPEKCVLGFFIEKIPEGNSFVYRIVDEFRKISLTNAYALTLKTGAYGVEQMLLDHPELEKYMSIKKTPRRRSNKQAKLQMEAPKVVMDGIVPQRRRGRPRKTPVQPVAQDDNKSGITLEDVQTICQRVKELSEMKDLNINVHVSFRFEGIGK